MQATSTPKLADQQPALLVVLATIALAVGIALGAALPGINLNFGSSGAVAAPDTSYNAVEDVRSQFGVAPDTSYDVVEANRGAGGWWASAPSTTVAGTPVSQADPDDRAGGGIR